MADYIKYDEVTGRITNRYKSVDGSNLTGNILKIDRGTFNALTKYHKVLADEVIEMSEEEKKVINDATQLIVDNHNKLVDVIKNKLKGLGFDDKETNYILRII